MTEPTERTLTDRVRDIITQNGRVVPENIQKTVCGERGCYNTDEEYLKEIKDTFGDWYDGF